MNKLDLNKPGVYLLRFSGNEVYINTTTSPISKKFRFLLNAYRSGKLPMNLAKAFNRYGYPELEILENSILKGRPLKTLEESYISKLNPTLNIN